jgi:hypothetical protein
MQWRMFRHGQEEAAGAGSNSACASSKETWTRGDPPRGRMEGRQGGERWHERWDSAGAEACTMAHAVPEDREPGREQAACVYGLAGGVGAAGRGRRPVSQSR